MAGFDTSARGTTTTIFKLLKNPEKMQKLKETLKNRVPVDHTGSNLFDVLNIDALNDLDYLQYAVKEGLRMDPPTSGSIDCKVN